MPAPGGRGIARPGGEAANRGLGSRRAEVRGLRWAPASPAHRARRARAPRRRRRVDLHRRRAGLEAGRGIVATAVTPPQARTAASRRSPRAASRRCRERLGEGAARRGRPGRRRARFRDGSVFEQVNAVAPALHADGGESHDGVALGVGPERGELHEQGRASARGGGTSVAQVRLRRVATPGDVRAARVELDAVDERLEELLEVRATASASSSARLTSSAAWSRAAGVERARRDASAPGFGRPIAFTIDAARGYPDDPRLGVPLRGPVTCRRRRSRTRAAPSARGARHRLSKPAARPTGFASAMPASRVRSDGSDGAADPRPRQGQAEQARRDDGPPPAGTRRRAGGRPSGTTHRAPMLPAMPVRPTTTVNASRTSRTPARRVGAPRRLRAVLAASARTSTSTSSGSSPTPPARRGRRAVRRCCPGRHPPRGAGGRGDAAPCGVRSRLGLPCRRSQGAEGVRHRHRWRGTPGGRDDRADRGRQHDRPPGAKAARSLEQGARVGHRARARPRRRGPPRGGGVRVGRSRCCGRTASGVGLGRSARSAAPQQPRCRAGGS